MQTHYVDLKVIPQEDRTQPQVVSDIMQTLHRYLPTYNNQENDCIAVSFPLYGQGRTLGGIVRLHGGEKKLLALRDNIASLSGYALIGTVQNLPAEIKGYAVFIRKQYKGTSAARRLKKRYEKRQDKEWTDELAAAVVSKYSNHQFLPFAEIKSSSTGQSMRLHIEKRAVTKHISGFFTGYGLSKSMEEEPSATVPLF